MTISLHYLGVVSQLSANLLLIAANVGDARKQKIQALHNLIPVSVLHLRTLLHTAEEDLSLHGGLRGRRGDCTVGRATAARLDAPQRGPSRVAKPPEYRSRAAKPTHSTESLDAAPVMQTTPSRRRGNFESITDLSGANLMWSTAPELANRRFAVAASDGRRKAGQRTPESNDSRRSGSSTEGTG
ncbi:hypothetical protein PVAP13_1NG419119 [Panicum virgatum]|uniref:Uncharacterized protein n=1 Tax=Panicum virgatum TaxID=38727 RepID=A0A8T0X9D6_PANVG|nr:hypothetical protein PVAP13_1NG419119 [Panicum virgatum]